MPIEQNQKAFDNKKYLNLEKKALLKRANKFDQLFLEIGGHLLHDGHASRVLPGYNSKNKLELIKSLNNKTAIFYCVSAKELELNRNWGNTNQKIKNIAIFELKKLIKEINICGVIISRFNNEKKAIDFALNISKLFNIPVYFNNEIKNYPNLKSTFSKSGFDAQPKIKSSKKIIVVTGAGANNGKLFFCLSQIYHQTKIGKNAGYAKIETFPVWDLAVNHPVNLAYMAATADINDKVMIDPYYKKAYGKIVVNYNRDIDAFKVLKKLIKKMSKKNNFMRNYKSPTDMGLNEISKGFNNEKKIINASKKEILNRKKSFEKIGNKLAVKRINKLLEKLIKS